MARDRRGLGDARAAAADRGRGRTPARRGRRGRAPLPRSPAARRSGSRDRARRSRSDRISRRAGRTGDRTARAGARGAQGEHAGRSRRRRHARPRLRDRGRDGIVDRAVRTSMRGGGRSECLTRAAPVLGAARERADRRGSVRQGRAGARRRDPDRGRQHRSGDVRPHLLVAVSAPLDARRAGARGTLCAPCARDSRAHGEQRLRRDGLPPRRLRRDRVGAVRGGALPPRPWS